MEEILKFFNDNMQMCYVVILSIILGIQVIESVPAVLHTPLMSGANAIHGVVIIGAIIILTGKLRSLTMRLIIAACCQSFAPNTAALG